MAAILLDTHALIWLIAGDLLDSSALSEIAKAQTSKQLFVSSISAWEAALASLKLNRAPNLLGLPADAWFNRGVRKIGARTVSKKRQEADFLRE